MTPEFVGEFVGHFVFIIILAGILHVGIAFTGLLRALTRLINAVYDAFVAYDATGEDSE